MPNNTHQWLASAHVYMPAGAASATKRKDAAKMPRPCKCRDMCISVCICLLISGCAAHVRALGLTTPAAASDDALKRPPSALLLLANLLTAVGSRDTPAAEGDDEAHSSLQLLVALVNVAPAVITVSR